MKLYRELNIVMNMMWKLFVTTGLSTILNFFYANQVCEKSTNDIMTMLVLNFVMTSITLCAVVLKNPIKVVDNRVDIT